MILIAIYFVILLGLTKPMGSYLFGVFGGGRNILERPLGWLERGTYRVLGIDPNHDQDWKEYAIAVLLFSFVSMVVTYGLLRLQGYLPLNAGHLGGKEMPAHLALNTSGSFTTNTNWQSYIPEQTISIFSNMVSLAFHNWASAASGIAIAVALVRGFARQSSKGIGNFWSDMVRGTIYLLFPMCLVGALVFVAMGVPQTFHSTVVATTLEGAKQTIAMGPVASQEIIKQLGTNGGGFFNANSAHPFENPSGISNFFTMLLIFLIPAGLTSFFGKMVKNPKQGWSVFAAMAALFLVGAIVCNQAEHAGNPGYAKYHVTTTNMEGKETRFGIDSSTLFATVTTDASCGAVNAMHDSFTPIGGLVPLFNILTGEVIFGGVGSGLYGMLLFAVVGVFIAGLMVGRTPEYLGKKIGKFEVQMAMIAILSMAVSILFFTALSAVLQLPSKGQWASLNTYHGSLYSGSDSVYGPLVGNLNNPGAHGFSELFYTFSSATGNNGSAFAGITANTPVMDTFIYIAMIIGRFLMIVPVLAIAGNLAKKKLVPMSLGTFPTDTSTFAFFLVGVVIILGALTFFPALALGPIVEHLQMIGAK